MPVEMIVSIELGDGSDESIGTLVNDAVQHHKLCGEGSVEGPSSPTFVRSAYGGRWWRSISTDLLSFRVEEGLHRAYANRHGPVRRVRLSATAER